MQETNKTKQNYETPEMEITYFGAEDVITTSGGGIGLPGDDLTGLY